MEYYNNNLKSEDGNNDNNNKKKNANHLDANGNNEKEAKQLIDTSMAMAEVALPQKYNVQNVKNMSSMFHQAKLFNSDISNWDVSNVMDMSKMFCCEINLNVYFLI